MLRHGTVSVTARDRLTLPEKNFTAEYPATVVTFMLECIPEYPVPWCVCMHSGQML